MNSNLFSSYPPDSPDRILQQQAQLQQLNANLGDMTISSGKNMQHPSVNVLNNVAGQKKKSEEFEVESDKSDQPKDKMPRRTIQPEQYDYLYRKYEIESRPSSEMLENIATEVGLQKRVVDIWFQTSRARERRGQRVVEDWFKNSKARELREQLRALEKFEVKSDKSDQPKDKMWRGTIQPEHLDYLYRHYQIESRPSREMLENIATEIGLAKRVVEIWFKISRSKERRGQFRPPAQVINKRCKL